MIMPTGVLSRKKYKCGGYKDMRCHVFATTCILLVQIELQNDSIVTSLHLHLLGLLFSYNDLFSEKLAYH